MSAQHHRHHHHTAPGADRRLLAVSLVVFVVFMAVEVAVGILANSLALLADAGHMLTDAAALALALVAAWAASQPVRGRWTFGFARAEILAAQANGIALVLIAAWITYEAGRRLPDPPGGDAALLPPLGVAGGATYLLLAGLLAPAHGHSLKLGGA